MPDTACMMAFAGWRSDAGVLACRHGWPVDMAGPLLRLAMHVHGAAESDPDQMGGPRIEAEGIQLRMH